MCATATTVALACSSCAVSRQIGTELQRATTPVATTISPTTVTTSRAKRAALPSAPAAHDHQLSLLVEPRAGVGSILDSVASAESTVDVVMYELADKPFERALVQAFARGAQVRVILDSAYHGGNVNRAAQAWLAGHDIAVHWAPSGTIFHQKTVIVGSALAWIGTGNLETKYASTSRDYWVRDTNAADVAAVTAVFNTDWGGSVPVPGTAPTGTDLVWSPGAAQRLVALIGSARTSVTIEAEEMDYQPAVAALQADARRGVDCTVIMTRQPQWLPALRRLAAAGVHVMTYAPNAQRYIHAKVIIVDSQTAFVGSENFSTASLDYNRELGIVTAVRSVVAPLVAQLKVDAAAGTPLA